MKSARMFATPTLFALALAGCGAPAAPDAPPADNATTPPQVRAPALLPLAIVTAGGARHAFRVEIAIDEQSQQRGLMGRTALPPDGGMLFPFAFPQTASFWMKDTPLPLDLLFVRTDGTIAAILEGKPNDLHPISSGEPVAAVLEIAHGRAAALGIAPGDRVSWGDCAAPAPAEGAWRADRFCPGPR